MTKRIFEEEVYKKELICTVLQCEPNKSEYDVVLDQTIFFPEGGGQPPDEGFIDGEKVLHVSENNGIIKHRVEKAFLPGQMVNCRINWRKRFSNMQNHSGEHIVSGIIHAKYGYDNVGFHMGSEAITLDMNGVLSEEELFAVEVMANEAIYQNIEVITQIPSKEELQRISYRSKKEINGEVRIVSIPGFDICACCGTHVKRTGEIGIIKVINSMRYKGGTRIFILCGMRALEDYGSKNSNAFAVSNLLSVKTTQILDAVNRLKKEIFDKEQRNMELANRLFQKISETIPDNRERICIFEENLDSEKLRRLCKVLCEKAKAVLVCSGTDEYGYTYIMGSLCLDVRPYASVLNQRLQGKGGGKPQMVQGTFMAKKQEIEMEFDEIVLS